MHAGPEETTDRFLGPEWPLWFESLKTGLWIKVRRRTADGPLALAKAVAIDRRGRDKVAFRGTDGSQFEARVDRWQSATLLHLEQLPSVPLPQPFEPQSVAGGYILPAIQQGFTARSQDLFMGLTPAPGYQGPTLYLALQKGSPWGVEELSFVDPHGGNHKANVLKRQQHDIPIVFS